jgi:ELWxxDGT repeat protein
VIVDDSLLFVGRKDTLVPNFNGTNATLTILAQELWTWSGSELSQVTDIYSQFAEPPFSGPSLDGLCVFNDRLYFVVHSQLWSWDGNSATPADELSEIHRPYELTAIDEQLFFTGEEAEIGHELCIWNGFDEPIVLDLNVGLKSSSPEQFTQLGNDVFFVATDNLHGRELWKWNGTEAQIVADIYPGRESSDVSSLTVFNGELYFAAYTKEFGRELWKWDGREATMVTDISPAEFRWAPLNSLTEFDNALFFAGTDAEHGTELWKLQAIPEPSGFLLALGGFALVMQLRRRH